MRLSELHTGERAIILKHHTDKAFRKRLMEMGFIPGEEILVVKNAPLKDPVEYRILNYDVTLRRSEAKLIEVDPLQTTAAHRRKQGEGATSSFYLSKGHHNSSEKQRPEQRIRVAFVGNPNCGKTSLFNAASGAHEHVGNYSGVTVEAKTATYRQGGYTIDLIDLPGAYSISSYSPEEKYISQYLMGDERPDVVVNVVDSTNLERHLYMTAQLLETSIPVVVALNMWDELEASSSELDTEQLTRLIGVPLCPTNGRTGRGIKNLFEHVATIYNNRSQELRVVDIRYRQEVETAIAELSESLREHWQQFPQVVQELRPRYMAIKLLEEDEAMQEVVAMLPDGGTALLHQVAELNERYAKHTDNDIQHDITNGRYGFVRGALQETYRTNYDSITERNRKIDHILTHKIWGFPIFIAIIFLMFQLTFILGEYPMNWIESGVAWLGQWIGELMPEGMLKDLLVDGVIAGVGGVLVFLPNIVILYLCLAIIEDTGYMARAAFIMDRLMHLIGLHGKSFIPLVMGFGCNVPAVMATRTIENRNNRLVTMLIIPFMSCSAKLPVYLLLAGAFFPHNAGLVLFVLYFSGILVAVLSALIFKRRFNTAKETPFVMELPPYRIPTLKSVLLHMWERAKQYLQKMGTVILVASIAIWALSYFPNVHKLEEPQQDALIAQHIEKVRAQEQTDFEAMDRDHQLTMVQQEYSLIGRLGHAIQPVFKWHGYDWRMSVSLLTGVAAKEIVVSTMGVLFTGDGDNEALLSSKLQNATYPDGSKVLDPVIALSFMIFVLVYIPCISTVVAIGRESGRWRYALYSTLYSISVGWVLALLVSVVGHLII